MMTNNSKEKVRQIQNKLYLTAKKAVAEDFMRSMTKSIGTMSYMKHGRE